MTFGQRTGLTAKATPLFAVLSLAGAACAGGSSDRTSSSSTTASATPPAAATSSSVPDAPSGALALQQTFVRVVHEVSPSVVQITTSTGLGSGVVLDHKGHIATNAHVVGQDRRFVVTLQDGSRRTATLVATFPPGDLAVIDARGSGFQPAVLGDSTQLQVGDIVLAMGNPLGLRSSVTQGIVSAIGRTVNEPTGAALPGTIQTSASINPGNSGGALVDLQGRVVGMPTLAANDPQLGGAAPGIGFAIPSNQIRDLATQMIAHRRVVASRRAFLGVELADGPQGPIVVGVDPKGPAKRAAIRPGDQLVKIDGQPTPNAAAVSALLAGSHPGQQVKLTLRHGGRTRSVEVRLGQLPAPAGAP
jgi:putative serine protease PepD